MQKTATADRNRLLIVLAVTALYLRRRVHRRVLFEQPRADFRRGPRANRHRGTLSRLAHALDLDPSGKRRHKTYGYLRAEILGALANGVFLWLLVIFIWVEAIERLRYPHPSRGCAVIAIATAGLGVNGFSAWITHSAGAAGEEGRPGSRYARYSFTSSPI